MSYKLGADILKLENVSLQFGDKLILRDINLNIKDIITEGTTTGQVCTLVGPSGIGKTQLLKIIAGLQDPSTGTIRVGVNLTPVKAGVVGMVAQDYPLFTHRTLYKNMTLVCNDKAKIDQYLNEFNLFEHRAKFPAVLSGGQRQRAAIVQQLLCSEHFILLDEPFSGLDPRATKKLCDIIIKVANMDEYNTVIISSHILEPSLAVSDSIWVLGNEYDSEGKKISGAVVRFTEDLAAQGLAWRADIKQDPTFTELCHKIEKIFEVL